MTDRSDTGVLVGARLSSDRSRTVFRAVLSAASRPGALVDLADDTSFDVPRAVIPVLALADLDVSVATLGHDQGDATRWQALVQGVTGCRSAPLADAEMILALRGPTRSELGVLRVGTPQAPERGARLFMSCRALTAGVARDATTVRLRGPGATDGRTFTVAGLERDVFTALAVTNRSFPAGVDSWLIADDGVMVGVPRSVRIELIDVPAEDH